LEENLVKLVAGQIDVILFTSAQQVVNLMALADHLNLTEKLRDALRRVAVASVGPTTSEMLYDQGWPVDMEPEHPKMGQLVLAAAERCAEVLRQKRNASVSVQSRIPPEVSAVAPWHDGPFLRACRHEPTDVTPICVPGALQEPTAL
jgi:hypothetical protein